MRRAFTDTGWILDAYGELVGLSSGSDACAEHETGIGPLRSAMGLPEAFENGLPDRIMSRHPPVLSLVEYTHSDGQPAACWMMSASSRPASPADPGSVPSLALSGELAFWDGQDLVAAWSENTLAVHVRGATGVGRLRALHDLARSSQLALGRNLVDPQSRNGVGGIVLVDASRVSPDLARQVLAQDQSRARLRAATDRERVAAHLSSAGLRWFALSPRWNDATESQVLYWLNPCQQSDYASGLYSADELYEWARGEGPVMIDKPLRIRTKALDKALDSLRKGLRRAGFQVPSMTVAWADPQHEQVEIQVRYYELPHAGKTRLEPRGYPLDELQKLAGSPRKPRASAPG